VTKHSWLLPHKAQAGLELAELAIATQEIASFGWLVWQVNSFMA